MPHPDQTPLDSKKDVHGTLSLEVSGSDASSDTSDHSLSKAARRRKKVRNIGRKTKLKTKELFHIDAASQQVHHEHDSVLDELDGNPAFNPQKIFQEKHATVSGVLDKATSRLQQIGNAVIHPLDATKRKAASTLATSEQPYLSKQADEALLKAHDELNHAISERVDSSDDEDHIGDLTGRVDELEEHRESMKVAWTTNRFVYRVRVVPKCHYRYPKGEDYHQYDENGNYVGFQYGRWFGHLLIYATQDFTAQYIDDFDEPPFDRDTLIQHVERIVMASAPWQAWFVSLRRIYRWEDPSKTARWFVWFVFLWLINRVMTFFWCYMVYIIVRHRLNPDTREALRDSHERALDRGASAHRFGDLINRHGSSKWLDPMIDDIGPMAQMQANDLADFLEMLTNYYEWKDPSKTIASLFFWSCCILISASTNADFVMRIVTLLGIMYFFMCRPVASRYPKYRHVVSPFFWMFYDIPTHAGSSFRYLRQHAQIARESVIGRKVEGTYNAERAELSNESYTTGSKVTESTYESKEGERTPSIISEEDDYHSVISSASPFDDVDLVSFRCSWHGSAGRLVVYTSGIRFIRSFPSKELWWRTYLELVEMRKLDGTSVGRSKKQKLLEFKFTDGVIDQVEAMKKRDEAFNTIIGFSGLQWQQLQPGPGRVGNGSKSEGRDNPLKKMIGNVLS